MNFRHIIMGALASLASLSAVHAAEPALKSLPQQSGQLDKQVQLKATVDQLIAPLMKQYGVPGMAVAITDHGKHYVFNYGLASRETGQTVNNDTLFEIGSVSKTLAVTLTTYAQAQGKLALTDSVSQHLPSLRGSSFDHVSLINLATHTAGNFPMQVPDAIKNETQLMDYFKQWKPADAAGTHRTYSNLGIGLLGIVTANSLGTTFAQAMEQQLFPALGMQHTYINVPPAQMQHYAQGYNGRNQPVRVNPDVLADEAYGVKTTASDLLRFVDINLGLVKVGAPLQEAVRATQTAYFKVGALTQDLVWEQFPASSKLPGLLTSVDDKIVFANNPATSITPPLPPQTDVLIHKTGSTGGFGAYVLYSPGKKTGIVILANRFYPGAERVTAAYRILEQLDKP